MPHNRTRLWVGLAIIAVTIPAVGTYYYGSGRNAMQGAPIAIAGRSSIESAPDYKVPTAIPVAQTASRDYLAEVRAVSGSRTDLVPDDSLDEGEYDDSMFEIGPIDESSLPPSVVAPPDPAPALVPQSSAPVAYSSDDPSEDDGNAAVADEPPTPTLSDANVYTLVLNNLSGDDRDEFVRTYAAMTPAQRSDLLAGFREQIENQ